MQAQVIRPTPAIYYPQKDYLYRPLQVLDVLPIRQAQTAPIALQNLAVIIRNVDHASFNQESGTTHA